MQDHGPNPWRIPWPPSWPPFFRERWCLTPHGIPHTVFQSVGMAQVLFVGTVHVMIWDPFQSTDPWGRPCKPAGWRRTSSSGRSAEAVECRVDFDKKFVHAAITEPRPKGSLVKSQGRRFRPTRGWSKGEEKREFCALIHGWVVWCRIYGEEV